MCYRKIESITHWPIATKILKCNLIHLIKNNAANLDAIVTDLNLDSSEAFTADVSSIIKTPDEALDLKRNVHI